MSAKRIALLGDTHYFKPEDLREITCTQCEIDCFYADYIDMIQREIDPDAFISVGDLTHGGTLEEFHSIYRIVERAGRPFFHVMGNHDLFLFCRHELKQLNHFACNTSLDFAGASLVFLDTPYEKNGDKNWGGDLDGDQTALVADVRSKNQKTPIVVFSHHPLYDTTVGSTDYLMSVDPEADVEPLFQPSHRKSLFVNGHVHLTSHLVRDGWNYYQLPSIFAATQFFYLEISENDAKVRKMPITSQLWLSKATTYGKNLKGHTFVPDIFV